MSCSAQALPDSVFFSASEEFKHPSLFKRILFGSNYRKEWETPVRMPVFDLRNDERGFKIHEMGGGHQTTSLYLKDKNGNEWALRSVDKKVQKDLLKGFFRASFFRKIVQDLVSTAYPYGGLSVPDLSRAAGVAAGTQQLYFVPDDTAYGEHRNDMANRAFILIEMEPTHEKDIKTDELLEKISESNKNLIDQKEELKSRLLDWLMADWDRHAKQVRWLQKDSGDRKWFYPLPRDRDQVFANSNGLLVIIAGRTVMPFLKGFRKNSTGIRQLSKKIDSLDVAFLNDLDKSEWENIIKEFQQNVSDSVIEIAVRKQPKEIFAIRGKEIIGKLKTRRDGLLKNAMKYYSFLAKKVDVKGSEAAEFFKVVNEPDKTHVVVYDFSKGDTSTIIYSRSFDPADTRMITICENGSDKILQQGEPDKIKVIIKSAARKTLTAFQEKPK